MPDAAYAVPILPGKLDAWRLAMERCQPANPEYVASRQRLGMGREAAWLQHTPMGDLAVVYIQADDLMAVFQGMGASQEHFDAWFREAILDVHGVDLTQPAPPTELVVDFTAPDVA